MLTDTFSLDKLYLLVIEDVDRASLTSYQP